MFEMSHDFEYMWLKHSKNRRRRQPIFQQKLKGIMKQKADDADTLTVTVKVLTQWRNNFVIWEWRRCKCMKAEGNRILEKRIGDCTTAWKRRPVGWKTGCFILRSFSSVLSISVCGKQINKTGRPWKVTSELKPHFFRHPIHFIVTSSIPHQQPAVSPTKSHPD